MSTASPAGERTEAPGQIAAFFDLDKTIIAKGAMVAFRRPLYEGGLINRRSVTRAVFAQLVYLHLGANESRLAHMRESILRVTVGWDSALVGQIVEEALSDIVEPIIFAEALELIRNHQAEGHRVVIVSASPQEIVNPLGRHLGVDETISSRAAVDDAGRYTGHMAFYAYGPYKAQAVKDLAEEHGIDLARSYAYSDSYTDVPMLELVGHPIAVNPDRVLSRVAHDRDWEVLHFIRPVRLRDAVRDRVHASPVSPATAFGVTGLAVIAIALGVVWWAGNRRGRSDSE